MDLKASFVSSRSGARAEGISPETFSALREGYGEYLNRNEIRQLETCQREI
ncbi:hypothetical protein OAH07_02210 [Verrucomicrobia bacterium]|nr:hypothetical protein [Verrucomicrobiota bacterium]